MVKWPWSRGTVMSLCCRLAPARSFCSQGIVCVTVAMPFASNMDDNGGVLGAPGEREKLRETEYATRLGLYLMDQLAD